LEYFLSKNVHHITTRCCFKAMNRLKSHIFFKSIALLFSTVYLFYALSSIFFVPRSLNLAANVIAYFGFSARRNSVERSEHTINFSRLADKCFLDDDQYSPVKFIGLLLIAFSGLFLIGTRRLFLPLSSCLFYNKQYSYLYLRTFRI